MLSDVESVEWSASCPNFMIMEHAHHANAMKSQILKEPYEPENGYYKVTDRPGLGVEVDEAALETYAFPGG